MILNQIAREKTKELRILKAPKRSLYAALDKPGISIIAEIKRASPSAGTILEDINIPLRVKQYEMGGASAISVVTERRFFKGNIGMLEEAKRATPLPVLRKDFIIDQIQVYESLFAGADALLLIVSLIEEEKKLRDLLNLAYELGMEALVEVHDEEELITALKCDAKIIGFNNRNLKTMTVDVNRCEHLMSFFKKLDPKSNRKVVAESGMKTKEDVKRLKELNFDGLLIGETLMRSSSPDKTIRSLLGGE
ncbi:indole-3-glycerol phosphate synthase [Acetomicrobium thermoterrenum DSM 13490]|uniref:Indole-3-glycerol phosphate synthase n=1 Tax=Acetomicrobium thermoterrenum DSM 13490 TaxID=1120987 RepID=A0A1H3H0X7_9BACT|nr:indole-3-glycerol phosphate synthase TrpC [Acetomicrobium thermoterrenum]SDY09243.1 indole-3-glycerol phosphate synthase [Acetomicrobium thermoterrenum DSM 13490]